MVKYIDISANIKIKKRKASPNQTKTKNFPEKCELKIQSERTCERSVSFFTLRLHSDKGIEMSPMVGRTAPTWLFPSAVNSQGRTKVDRKSQDLVGPTVMVGCKWNGKGRNTADSQWSFDGTGRDADALEVQGHVDIPTQSYCLINWGAPLLWHEPRSKHSMAYGHTRHIVNGPLWFGSAETFWTHYVWMGPKCPQTCSHYP